MKNARYNIFKITWTVFLANEPKQLSAERVVKPLVKDDEALVSLKRIVDVELVLAVVKEEGLDDRANSKLGLKQRGKNVFLFLGCWMNTEQNNTWIVGYLT